MSRDEVVDEGGPIFAGHYYNFSKRLGVGVAAVSGVTIKGNQVIGPWETSVAVAGANHLVTPRHSILSNLGAFSAL
jgi:hypothetical protein